jgi:TPR repeat protein
VDHQVEYANILVEGRGVEVNHREALAWYEKAAGRNYEYAFLPLARLYAGGLGTDRDLIKAFALAELAAVTFDRSSDSPTRVAEARSLQAQIQDQLGPREIERGKNRAKEWGRQGYKPDS